MQKCKPERIRQGVFSKSVYEFYKNLEVSLDSDIEGEYDRGCSGSVGKRVLKLQKIDLKS